MSCHRSRFAPLLSVVVCAALATTGFAADLRTWRDSTGEFSLSASFVRLKDGIVTLRQEDGEEVEIELKQLSPADQKVAADFAKGKSNPFKAKNDPFKTKSKTGTKTGTTKPAGSPKPSPAAPPPAREPRTIDVDLSAVEQLSLVPPGEWKVDVPNPPEVPGTVKGAPLPPKSNFFEGLAGLAVSAPAAKGVVAFTLGEPKPEGTTRLVVCDLKTGKSTAPISVPGQFAPLAIHDSGEQIVVRRNEWGFGNADRLEVWRISDNGKEIVKDVIVTPYAHVQGPPRDVTWAEFVNPEQLVTSSRAGHVVLWSFPSMEPLLQFQTGDGSSPALSADRALLAYCTGTDLGIVDLNRRELIALQAVPERLTWPQLAFSPSGKRLAAVAFDRVVVWETASGKLEQTIPAAGLHINGAIAFPHDDFVLAGNKFLFEVVNQVKCWTYDGHDQVRTAGRWTFFAINGGDKPGLLLPLEIPHAEARALLDKALKDPQLFIVKPGTKVKLNLGMIEAGQRKGVEAALTARLKTIDCTVAENGTIELQAQVDGPKTREISYHGSGDYKVKEYIARLKFVFNGQTAWETFATNVPGIITLKRGENIEGVLRAREKPDYDFYSRVELPKFVQKPLSNAAPGANPAAGGSLTLGQSRLTPSGLK